MKIKKILLLATMLTSTTIAFSQGRNIIETRLSFTFNGKYNPFDSSSDKSIHAKTGYEVNAEWLREIYSDTYFGLGLGFQKHGDAKIENAQVEAKDLYSSIPFYIALKHQFNTDGLIQPFIKTNLGASFNITENGLKDSNRGINGFGYYATLGGGFEIDNFILDLSYEINTAKTDQNEEDDLDLTRFTLGLGYRFDF